MFLTRKQVIIRNIKKTLYALGCVGITFAVIFVMMLMITKHNEMSNWFYGLFGM